VLEPASQEFVEATSTPPFTYELTPADARKVLADVQATPIEKLPVEDEWITVLQRSGRLMRGSCAPRTQWERCR
jgi:acetyl esterase